MLKFNEKLGVPEGIDKESEELYKKVINDIYKIDFTKCKLNDREDTTLLVNKYDITIAGEYFKNIPFIINLIYYKGIDKPTVFSLSYNSKTDFYLKDKDISIVDFDKNLSINIAVDKLDNDSIIKSIKNDVNVSSIAHELKHLYDFSKKNSSIKSLADYQSIQISGFPTIISEFLYLLYYTMSAENLVRPTELYKELIDNKVTKDNFIMYMKSSKTIDTIEKAEKFSLSEFMNKLNNDDDVKKILDIAKDRGFKITGDNTFDILNLVFINISGNSINTAGDIINSYIKKESLMSPFNLIEILIGGKDIGEETKKIAEYNFNKVVNYYKKYEDNPIKFFEYLEKKLNFVGMKLKRKLYKLYDMLKHTKEKSSILNWDLHTKISSKNENLKYTIDFDKFKVYNK